MAAAGERLVLDIHGIGPKPSWVEPAEDLYWCDAPATYERILDAAPEVAEATGTRIEFTFDDGNASDFDIAAPALAKRGLTGAFFVCAGRIGEPRYLDRAQMRDMIAAGMTIGSHGWSHIDWRKTDDKTLDREVNGAKRKIEDEIGRQVDQVAIPFGSYDRRVMSKLGDFRILYTSDGGLVSGEPRIVPRVSYRKDWTDATLMQTAAARAGALARAKRALELRVKRLR
jgi:peptidoglycan/xylan/chitin deacetylase (PgdA/CDA1 family)